MARFSTIDGRNSPSNPKPAAKSWRKVATSLGCPFSHRCSRNPDFYHAAGQLWEGADAIFGLPSSTAEWFTQARHTLRHQGADPIIADLSEAAATPYFEPDRIDVIRRVRNYFRRHRDHLQFPDFDEEKRPLGSGFVESAVKWLIQQRFKGVGMRWSSDGFNHLLLLRLAWANDRFDDLFLPDPPPSPI